MINNKSAFKLTRPICYQLPEVEEEMVLLRQFVSVMEERRRMIPYQNLMLTRVLRRFRLKRPSVFRRLPHIFIGAVQAELGRWCLARYPLILQNRNRNAQILASEVPLKTWPEDANVTPAWLKQKIRIPNMHQQRSLSSRVQR